MRVWGKQASCCITGSGAWAAAARVLGTEARGCRPVSCAPPAGDMVVFMKDGSRLELLGLERAQELKKHMQSCITDAA